MSVLRSSIIALVACAMVASGAATASAASANAPVTITAANWKFAPAEITVHVGQPVTLDLTSTEGVHGLASDELGLPATIIMPGRTKSVTFTPKKAGTYVLHCTLPCGPGHGKMTLTVHVVA
jgi:cytochrome c oxidase subunit 2